MFGAHRYLIAFALATSCAAFPAASFAGVFVGIGIGSGGVGIAPPALPIYEQPPCLVADTIWTPGYWAYGPYGYYWVPGTWVEAPQVGYLWTPGYWGYGDGRYAWHGGYWGPHVGFYGGVNYGFGYGGNGYDGGGWRGDHFRYNTAYTHVDRTTIDNVYVDRTVVNDYDGARIDRTSYNGGEYGLRTRPTADEIAYRDDRHLPLTPVQRQHIDVAEQNRNFRDSVNHGRPSNADFGPARPSRDNADNRTTTDPFSRFDRERSATTDPYSRFGRNAQSYASSNARASEPSRFDREQSTTTDPYARFDRNARNAKAAPGEQRAANAYYPQTTKRSASSYGTQRYTNAYHPQTSNRSERSYGAPTNRYHPDATYRSHAAPQAERPSERSRPTRDSESHHH